MRKPLFLILVLSFMNLWITKAESTNGVLSYWPLDGYSQATDEAAIDASCNDYHLVLAPGPKWVEDGMVNGTVELDGTTRNIIDVDKSVKLTLDKITVMAWVNGWKTDNWARIIVGRSESPF